MSHKVKSSLYFASLVLALATYYSISETNQPEAGEMASATAENSIAVHQ